MSFLVLPVISSTPRSVRPFFSLSLQMKWMHTSAIFTARATNETEMQTEINKTSQVVETVKNKAVCSILESKVHRALLAESSVVSMIDIIVIYILASDITVYQVALDSNISIVIQGLVAMRKFVILKDSITLNPAITVGYFTRAEDAIIRKNWKNLIQKLDLVEDEVTSEVFKIAEDKGEKGCGLKRNIVGYHLSQGLDNIRLATEVFHRAKTLLSASKGSFSPEEDQIILNFVEKEGKKFTELTRLMHRTSWQSVRYRFETLEAKNENKQGALTVEDGKILIREIFEVNKNILNDGKLSKENCRSIGEKISRCPTFISYHWKHVLEPLLTAFHAGTEDVDIKEVLIQHMVEQEMDYTQQVDWKELVKLDKFSGTTQMTLRRTYQNLLTSTKRTFPQLSEEELNTGAIQRYLEGRRKYKKRKKDDYQEMVIRYYVTNILDKESWQAVKYKFEALEAKNQNKQGALTVKDGKILIREIFKVNKNILNDGELSKENCRIIGEKISRCPTYIFHHWKNVLEPLLTEYHAGTEVVDIKEVLIQHMVEQELDNTHKVNWKELAILDKFSGTKPLTLRRAYHNLLTSTKRTYPQLSEEELNTRAIQRYLGERRKYKKSKKDDYQEMVIRYYVNNILCRE